MNFLINLSWFFKLRWKQYATAISLNIFDYTVGLLPPIIVGSIINAIRDGELTRAMLNERVLLLVCIALVIYGAVFTWVNMLFRNSILVERLLRFRMLAHLTGMTPAFFQRNSRGDLMAQATNDIRAVNMAAGFGVMTLVHTLVGGVLVVTMMFVIGGWQLTLAALLPMPFISLAIRKLGGAMRVRFLDAQAAFGRLNDQALESISGVRVIRSYVQEEADVEAFSKVAEDTRSKNARVSMINALFQPVITILVGVSFSIGLGYGAYRVMAGEMSLGYLFSFSMYLGMLIWPMIAFGEFINVMQRGSASAQRIDHTLKQQTDVKEPEHPVANARPGTIVFEQLSFRYPEASDDSLRDISLTLEPGQTLGVVGKTGGGKSTLLKQLLRQYPVQPGSLTIGGSPIEQIASDVIRSWLGYVPQEYLLLSRTIRDNICLGKADATDEEVQRVVELASLQFDLAEMKDGLHTLIGENGLMLSGGQKQRIGIARALLVEPEILILDDALSAVDARTESTILHNIRRERIGKTTCIATHRLSAVQHADWIIVLDRGRIVEEGTHEQLMLLGGWYKEQFKRQQIEASLD